tara:strand:- start:64 stop:582 length:519 start_codon:yes stop_codon:yes gene_type:complete
MKRIFPIIMLLMSGTAAIPVRADLVHRLTTSTQLQVDGALTSGTRIGSTYSSSGNNITASTFGGLTAASGDDALTAPATMTDATYAITTAGSAYSFSESWTQGDAVNPIGTGVDVSAGVVADMPAYGNVLTQSGGVAGSLAGTITSAGVITLTAGGAGTSATGQFVSELTVN